MGLPTSPHPGSLADGHVRTACQELDHRRVMSAAFVPVMPAPLT